jgi:hypothetical protein
MYRSKMRTVGAVGSTEWRHIAQTAEWAPMLNTFAFVLANWTRYSTLDTRTCVAIQTINLTAVSTFQKAVNVWLPAFKNLFLRQKPSWFPMFGAKLSLTIYKLLRSQCCLYKRSLNSFLDNMEWLWLIVIRQKNKQSPQSRFPKVIVLAWRATKLN